jgi:hypothetical protein
LYDPITDVANVEIITADPAAHVAVQLLKSRLEVGTASADDAIPNLLVYSDIRVLDAAMDQVVRRGDIYSRVLEYLRLCDAGIKTMRPNGAQITMDLVVHDGVDRINSVIFYAQYEDLDDAKYFQSIKGYKNYALIAANVYARLYRNRDILVDLTGLDRRVLYVEADDIDGLYDPPTADDAISARGQATLDEHKKISLIQATISKTAKPKFKIDYDVGDLVTVFGEFATAQVMRVTEHILTVDKDGMRGFPSLSAI